MSTGTPSITSAEPAGAAHSLLTPRAIVAAVLLAIALLFVITSLRASLPGYQPSPQVQEDRPVALPDR